MKRSSFIPRYEFRKIALLLACKMALSVIGCGSLQIYSFRNEPYHQGSVPTATTLYKMNESGAFVGVALSGGGSRAANFSSAVLLELERLGLLQFVTDISSVSGGSLPAAYYGLFYDDSERWNADRIKQIMQTDFERRLAWKVLAPHNILRYSLTNYDRTDLLAAALDDVLFDGKTFKDFKKRVLINSTKADFSGDRFTFTDASFAELGSRLDKYPVAHAVAASAAFPGAFHNVTLRNFASPYRETPEPFMMRLSPLLPPPYLHIYDGGIDDNLGISTLIQSYSQYALALKSLGKEASCFLFVVNSEVSGGISKQFENGFMPDLRSGWSYIVDANALHSSDILFRRAQGQLRRLLGLDKGADVPFYETLVVADSRISPLSLSFRCAVWHINLERFAKNLSTPADRNENGPIVDQISTRFMLTGPAGYDSQTLQKSLFDAARALVSDDREVPFLRACSWFRTHDLKTRECEKYFGENSSFRPIAPHSSDLMNTEPVGERVHGDPTVSAAIADWQSPLGFGYTGYTFDARTGSSFRFHEYDLSEQIGIFYQRPERRNWLGEIERVESPEQRLIFFLREWIKNCMGFKIVDLDDELSVAHPVIDSQSKNVRMSPVGLYPLDQEVRVKLIELGGKTYASAEFRSAFTLDEAIRPMRTHMLVSDLMKTGDSWSFSSAWYHIPENLQLEETETIKSVFADILAQWKDK